MKLRADHLKSIAFGLLLVLASVFLYQHPTFPRYRAVHSHLPRIATLFEKTKTVCFGRFLIDVPATASIVFGSSDVPVKFARIEGQANDMDRAIAFMRARFAKEIVHDDMKGPDSPLGTVVAGPRPGQTTIFGTSGTGAYVVASFFTIDTDLYAIETSGWNLNEPGLRSWKESLALVDRTATAFTPLEPGAIPFAPGVCLHGGLLPDSPDLTHENIRLGVRLAEYPDIHVSIETRKNQQYINEPMQVYYERAKSAAWTANPISAARIRHLRDGKRAIGPWLQGFEHLTHLPRELSSPGEYDFRFGEPGEPWTPYRPEVDIQLSSGVVDNASGRVPPSLNEEEAIALWDRLTTTIRPRPVGQPRSEAPPDDVPLHIVVASGQACPRSGWWHCTHEGRIEGDRERHLRQGEPMPTVVPFAAPTLWQRASGTPPVSQPVATAWVLATKDPS